jgi:hypothetical protein
MMGFRSPNERVFKIIVPIGKREQMEGVADKMVKNFRGVTIFPMIRGYWRNPETGQPVYDDNFLLMSARTVNAGQDHLKIFGNDWNFMRDLAKETATKFDQQEVMIEQDIIRGAEFVKPYSAIPTDLQSPSRGLEKVI